MKLKFKQSLIPRNQKFTIACSGGIDSVAITHYLVTRWFKTKPQILYVDNELFEEDCIASQNIGRLAQKLCCQLIHHVCPVSAESKNLETVCRNTRMSAYKDAGTHIVVCHHLDDCVESYLMNCLNGTREYEPIPEQTIVCHSPNVHYSRFIYIIRPFLLTVTKKDLEAYCMANNLTQYVVNDPLNAKSTRGWLRREILPKLKEKYPGIDKVVRKMYL